MGTNHADPVLGWLLKADPAVAYHARRDLLDQDDLDARAIISRTGSASRILAARHSNGHWGDGFYQPKWTSTHYTLLELRDHQVDPSLAACRDAVSLCLGQKGRDGGVNPSGTITWSDVCINGMFLAVAAYFGARPSDLASLVDFILGQQLDDGGFNCRSNRSGCRVSSVHTTASVLDGFSEYLQAGHPYRADAVRSAVADAVECLLARRLYQVKTTGAAIHPDMVRLHHPARWRFDVLRGLEVVTTSGASTDERVSPALEVLLNRRRHDGTWTANSGYPGAVHVAYSTPGTPSPWITLRALRVLRSVNGPTQ